VLTLRRAKDKLGTVTSDHGAASSSTKGTEMIDKNRSALKHHTDDDDDDDGGWKSEPNDRIRNQSHSCGEKLGIVESFGKVGRPMVLEVVLFFSRSSFLPKTGSVFVFSPIHSTL